MLSRRACRASYTIQAQLFGWIRIRRAASPCSAAGHRDVAQFTHTAGVGASNFNHDSDGDGLLDNSETALGTDINDADTDNDGAATAPKWASNVNAPINTDGDGIINAPAGTLERRPGGDGMNQPDPANNNPCAPNAAFTGCPGADDDSDGLTNAQEGRSGHRIPTTRTPMVTARTTAPKSAPT